jgi:hypothetical protein
VAPFTIPLAIFQTSLSAFPLKEYFPISPSVGIWAKIVLMPMTEKKHKIVKIFFMVYSLA